ncbi:ankyrin repeat domain-containing protein [Undibacterium sp.]|uniref:ankyrin repeat domain-containing protein n=1 Tax=Undibacterium sp. TaxID=1914977 RepID=UPI00374DDD11
MMNFRKPSRVSRNAAALLAAVFLSAAAPSSRASNDGHLCDGPAGIVLCGSLMAVDALTPKMPAERLTDAARQGDLDKLKSLLAVFPNTVEPFHLLSTAMYSYVYSEGGKAKDADKLKTIQFFLDKGVDITQGGANTFAVSLASGVQSKKRLEMTELLMNHGASAKNVELSVLVLSIGRPGYAESDDMSYRMLQVLLEHGADPNRTEPGRRPALLSLVMVGQFTMAELLLQHGADPDAAVSLAQPSGLLVLARYCGKPDYKWMTKEVADRNWNTCVQALPAKASFMVEHGAEVNGRASTQNQCATPYDIAKKEDNALLAKTLLELKADPRFGQKCLAGG